MTTYCKQSASIILIILLIIGIAPTSFAQDNSNYITVNGVVKDKRSKKKLQFVSVSVPGTDIGTVTNTDGEFSIKIKDSLQAKELEVSHIGYTNYRLPLANISIYNADILLAANENLLDEVVIQNIDPYQLIKEAISRIDNNYTDKANLFTGFYRETVQKRRNYINISEAIIDIYKTPYGTYNVESDRVQILKGRKLISPKPSDTLMVKLQGGPTLPIQVDIIKNPDIILSNEELSHYKFDMEDPIMINERPHFVVSFKPAAILPYPLYYGKLYIDKQTLTFSRAELNLSMDNKNKATQAILRKKPFKLQFKPEEVSFLINYKQRDGRSYLYYIRNIVRFKCDWKKKWIFATGYTITSETVITDSKQNDISNIPHKLAFRQTQSLSDKVDNFYDPNFWEGYNIIEPTESLESAVNKLRKQ